MRLQMYESSLFCLRRCYLKLYLTAEVTEARRSLGIVEQNFVSVAQSGHINIRLNQH